jgi:hypothetical protein
MALDVPPEPPEPSAPPPPPVPPCPLEALEVVDELAELEDVEFDALDELELLDDDAAPPPYPAPPVAHAESVASGSSVQATEIALRASGRRTKDRGRSWCCIVEPPFNAVQAWTAPA